MKKLYQRDLKGNFQSILIFSVRVRVRVQAETRAAPIVPKGEHWGKCNASQIKKMCPNQYAGGSKFEQV